jgi:adenosylmethionine-8-amino-7-oxononanoate aminotransferase
LIANGVYVFNFKNVLFVVPPLVITREQLDEGLTLLDEGLAELMDTQVS